MFERLGNSWQDEKCDGNLGIVVEKLGISRKSWGVLEVVGEGIVLPGTECER